MHLACRLFEVFVKSCAAQLIIAIHRIFQNLRVNAHLSCQFLYAAGLGGIWQGKRIIQQLEWLVASGNIPCASASRTRKLGPNQAVELIFIAEPFPAAGHDQP